MLLKYKKEDEEPIGKNIGYPYNVIPKGFPNKISNKKLGNTVELILNNLKANAGVETIVTRDSAFINIGLNELTNRQNKIQSIIALLVSLVSLAVAFASLYVSNKQIYYAEKSYLPIKMQQNSQIREAAEWCKQQDQNELAPGIVTESGRKVTCSELLKSKQIQGLK